MNADLANHLWQSTWFAGVVFLLALALTKNHAGIRYRRWFIASLKFLLPFSLLIAAGRHVNWPTAPAETPAALISVIESVEGISQPFTVETPANVSSTAAISSPQVAVPSARRLPVILFWVWLAGAGFVLLLWLRDWRRMRISLNTASEVDFDMPIRVFMAETPTEPGIVGILRPALLLPKGLRERHRERD